MPPSVESSRQQVLHGLYAENHSWLVSLLLRRMRHQGDAQDIASETFCQVVASREDPSLIREPRAYLTRIAKRLVSHLYRDREIERAYLQWLETASPDHAPSAEERAMAIQAIAQLDRLLDGLPRDVRRAFLYSQFDEMGYDEIAARLGVSTRTVARHIKQALLHCVAVAQA
ncbi:FIG006045: Sigma factor, ECF subfamily [plant metagenome]